MRIRFRFRGTLPVTITTLDAVEVLDLTRATLFGRIPWKTIGALTKLTILNLRNNAFTDDFPNFSSLVNLKTLHLEGNKLVGSVDGLVPRGLTECGLAGATDVVVTCLNDYPVRTSTTAMANTGVLPSATTTTATRGSQETVNSVGGSPIDGGSATNTPSSNRATVIAVSAVATALGAALVVVVLLLWRCKRYATGYRVDYTLHRSSESIAVESTWSTGEWFSGYGSGLRAKRVSERRNGGGPAGLGQDPIVSYTGVNPFIVRESFAPSHGDEMSLVQGNFFEIRRVFRDGWAEGMNLDARTSDFFPLGDLQRLMIQMTKPSFFLLSYILSLVINHKPCLYCSCVLLALFSSTCVLWASTVDQGWWPADLVRVVATQGVMYGDGGSAASNIQWHTGDTGAVRIERVVDGAEVFPGWDVVVEMSGERTGATSGLEFGDEQPADLELRQADRPSAAGNDYSKRIQQQKGTRMQKTDARIGGKLDSVVFPSPSFTDPQRQPDEQDSHPGGNTSAFSSSPSSTNDSTSTSSFLAVMEVVHTTSPSQSQSNSGSRCYLDFPRPHFNPLRFLRAVLFGGDSPDARFVWWFDSRPRNVVYVGGCGE
ncbi:hypothetical protein HDU93_001845 [Gonapodya sp. JEL0774]|nr:hypothetical protein HDU93_001845 [Gonapodya sp. JEL0774]